MKRDLDNAVVENLAIFREEPEYAALRTLYPVPVIDMTLSAFVLVVSSALDSPPTEWTDLDLILSALILQLPIDGQPNRTFMIASTYLRWLLPTQATLDDDLKKIAQDQRLRLPHLSLAIPKLNHDTLSPWHQARLQLSWTTFMQLRKPFVIGEFEPAFAKRVDEALVAKMYLEGRQMVWHYTPEVLQHVLLGDLIFEAQFLPSEYAAVLAYLEALFDQLPLPQAPGLKAVVVKVRPYVLNAVDTPQWFSEDKRRWIVQQKRLMPAHHLLTLRELAERRGIKVNGTAPDWRLQVRSVEAVAHLDEAERQVWHASNAGRARKVLVPLVLKMPLDQLPGRMNLPTAIAGVALLGDLMYARHLQLLRYWEADALEDVLITIAQPLHARTKADFCQLVRLLLMQLQDTWPEAQFQALLAVVDQLLAHH